jgi:hypothetical protein
MELVYKKLNMLYLNSKISVIEYNKLEKLYKSKDNENKNLALNIISSKFQINELGL